MQTKDIENIVYTYGDDLYRFCCHLTSNKEMAEELYQDTFVKVIEISERIDENGNVKGYLFSIAINLWKNHVRKKYRRQNILPEADFEKVEAVLEVTGQDIAELLIKKEKQNSVRLAVGKLPQKHKLVLLLYYGQDMTTEEIAKVLHIPKGTVMSRLAKAREKIRKEMEVKGYEI